MSENPYKYKTTAVAQAFVKNTDWEPKSLQAALKDAPKELVEASSADGFNADKDLMKVVSVLVSTGMNRNDDVFLAEELAPVRSSGAHKPFNIEHSSTEIVGHMTRTYLTDKNGNEIAEATLASNSGLPQEDFDVTNEGVVYAYVLPKVAKEIRERAAAGELFVSVEMWFEDYDYLVGNQVVKRNTATAFLDESLRCNGGAGEYKGERVGRALRNMLIGGIGFVKKPANPDSVIRSIASLSSEGARDVSVYSESAIAGNIIASLGHKAEAQETLTEEKTMSKEIFEEMKATLDAAIEKIDERVESAVAEAITANKDEPNGANASDSGTSNDETKELSPDVQALVATVDGLKKMVSSQTETINDMKEEAKAKDRRLALSSIFENDSRAQKVFEISSELGDGSFKSLCELFTEVFNEHNLSTAGAEDEDDDNTDNTEGGDDESVQANAGDDENDASDDDGANSAEASDDDMLIDMGELEDEDADIGSSESKSKANLDDQMSSTVSRIMAKRNSRWLKAVASDENED